LEILYVVMVSYCDDGGSSDVAGNDNGSDDVDDVEAVDGSELFASSSLKDSCNLSNTPTQILRTTSNSAKAFDRCALAPDELGAIRKRYPASETSFKRSLK
jgi:hypothetical protein